MDYIFKCFLCQKEFGCEKVIISHLKFEHFLKDNTSEMKCVIKGRSCAEVFFTYSSLKLHLKKCVKNINQSDLSNVNQLPEYANEVNACPEVLSFRCSEDNYFSLENVNGLQRLRSETVDSHIFQFETAEPVNPNEFCEEKMNQFLDMFNNQMCNLMLSHEKTTTIFNLCIDLVQNISKLNQSIIDKSNGLDFKNSLKLSVEFVTSKLRNFSTKYKREKKFESNELYVAPVELTMGVRFNMSRNDTTIAVPRLISCKFHYIPITATIFSLFQRDDFRKEYFKFNRMNGQRKVNGVYSQYSCGSRFESSELFSTHPNSLQIEIATDDFDVCNAIGSKATMHKLCPVYIAIKNIPPQFSSRLDAISLASLCYSDDMKTEYTDFNDVWRQIVRDISYIENGIDIGGEIIRGTISYFSSDNLGQHTALGFVQNFSTTEYCCRFCTCPLFEMKTLCKEIPSKIRTIEQYNEQIRKINDSAKVDLKESKGVLRYCALNDLKYFNIIDGMVPDIMHDLNEGAVPFVLKYTFELLINEKVFSEKQINDSTINFDYGQLNKNNIPSKIGLKKRSLGQNASQILCLLYHMPYIFYRKKDDKLIKSIWICIESLIHIVQIVYSTRIDENDLQNLEYWTEIHLQKIQQCLKRELIRKHHFMTHYGTIIRKMGPIKAMSMVRFEGKHKALKAYAVQTQNFINITKTISERHQQHNCMTEKIFTDRFDQGKTVKPIDIQFFDDHENLFLANNIFYDEKLLLETPWLSYNSFNYRRGFFIFAENCLFKIEKILIFSSEHYLLCNRFQFIKYDSFLNSIEIKENDPVSLSLFKFNSLDSKFVYESKILNSRIYIILETLDLKSILVCS